MKKIAATIDDYRVAHFLVMLYQDVTQYTLHWEIESIWEAEAVNILV